MSIGTSLESTESFSLRQFQLRALQWMSTCFPDAKSKRVEQRALRFLEEAIELAQAVGVTAEQAALLTKQVYDKPVGEARFELGAVMVTLSGVACACTEDLASCAENELTWCIEHSADIQRKNRNKLTI